MNPDAIVIPIAFSEAQKPGCLPPGCDLDSLLTREQFCIWRGVSRNWFSARKNRLPGVINESRNRPHSSPNLPRKISERSEVSLLNLIGLSSGKDSTALLGWAIHESGYPRESIICVFTDTENEYEEVYQQIRDLNDYCLKHGVAPVVYLRASGDWVEKFWMFPLVLGARDLEGAFPVCQKPLLYSVP
jgi:hypothetical protein